MSSEKPLIYCLYGPTAVGKTALSIELAKAYDCEIISVDSSLVYKGMDIGSGKPSVEEREGIPHHLIDLIEPNEPYSAAKFCEDATSAIEDMLMKGKRPLLVGGTMLYFKALLFGLSELPSQDIVIRQQIEQDALDKGWPALHQKLGMIDPISAEKIKPNDAQRIERALEVYQITGQPLSSFFTKTKQQLPYPFRQIALLPRDDERHLLHAKIEERFDKMLDKGLIEEVNALRNNPTIHDRLPAIRAVGYRQVWQYLNNEIDFTLMRQKALAATRQLAKRQLTWLRSWENVKVIEFMTPEQQRLQQAANFLFHI